MAGWVEDLRERVVADVEVTNQLVAAAQAFFVQTVAGRAKTADLLAQLLKHHSLDWPAKVTLDSRSDNAGVVARLVGALTMQVAGVEAIWRLVHRDQLIAAGTLQNLRTNVGWEAESHGSGWVFQQYEIPYPTEVIRAPSQSACEVLCNHDLYIREVGIPGLSEEVERSLREAVQCFASELYTACAAMLGSASEGAWMEFGYSLAGYLSLSDGGALGDALRKRLEDPYASTAKKVSTILEHYGDGTHCGRLWEKSNVTRKGLQHILIWSDVVRDSRNSIHYGVDPRTPNTREKLAALLLGAIPFFRTLYTVAASIEPPTPSQ